MAKSFKPTTFTEALAAQIMGIGQKPGQSMEEAVSQYLQRLARSATDIHVQGDTNRDVKPCYICSNGGNCPGLEIAMKTDEAILKARRSVF